MSRGTNGLNKTLCLLAAALLFAASCDNFPGMSTPAGTSEKETTPTTKDIPGDDNTGIGINALCIYAGHVGVFRTQVFQNDVELTSFLETTLYDKSYRRKEITHQPDFEKWTYFAYVGGLDSRNVDSVKIDVSEGKDTITITRTWLTPPGSHLGSRFIYETKTGEDGMVTMEVVGRYPCFMMYAPPQEFVNIYYIPFTKKAIKFADAYEHFKCGCGYDPNNEPKIQVEPGTLLFARQGCGIGKSSAVRGEHILRNEAQLTSFFEAVGYDDDANSHVNCQKMAHKPDFKKWTYFAFAGLGYRLTVTDVSYGKDVVTVNYDEYNICHQPANAVDGHIVLCAPPPYRIVVYFIPFTEKPIEFVRTNK